MTNEEQTKEWISLIMEAKKLGLTKKEVSNFFKKTKKKEIHRDVFIAASTKSY